MKYVKKINLVEAYFSKVAGFSAYNSIKIGHHHRFLPVNFPKIRSSFSTEHLQIAALDGRYIKIK